MSRRSKQTPRVKEIRATESETRPAGLSDRWAVIGVCLSLVAVIWVAFGQTTHFGFVNYDDDLYVYDNAHVTGGLTWQSLSWMWSHVDCNFYHPLTMISLMLDYRLHGLAAGGYHLTNVLIHTASSVLLFLVLRRMTGALWRSALVAAVFAVHPLRAESVAWVSERKDVLGAFFFMLTLWAYASYVGKQKAESRKQKYYYGLVLVFFALGLLCKPTAVALPFVLFLLDYWPLGRLEKQKASALAKATADRESREQKLDGRGQELSGVLFWGLVREKIPLLALAVAGGLVAYFAEGKAVASMAHIPVGARIVHVLVAYAVYLRQMVWPADLAVFYPYPAKLPPLGEIGAAFLVLAGVSAGVLKLWRKRPPLLVGWLWYLGMMVPVIGMVQVGEFAHADRNTYLPQIGLYVMVVWGAWDWIPEWKHRRAILGSLMAVVIGALLVCARKQTAYWTNSEALWKRALACVPENSLARNGLGSVFVNQGKLDEAIAQYRMALEIRPNFAEAHNNLGLAFFQKGELEAAIAQYEEALKTTPDYPEAHNNLGTALLQMERWDDAIAQYQLALQVKPGYAEAHSNLGLALYRQGRLDAAVAEYRQALALRPGLAGTRGNLGEALLRKGDFAGAMACFEKITSMSQDPLTRWNSLGTAFLQKGQLDEAIACYRQATRVNPRQEAVWANLGLALFQSRKSKEAAEAWEQALAIAPDRPGVQNNLAWLLATTEDASLRDGSKAVTLAAQASRAAGGGDPLMLRTLAAAYAETGSFGLASVTARRALELAVERKNDTLAATLRKEISLYEAETPVRDAP